MSEGPYEGPYERGTICVIIYRNIIPEELMRKYEIRYRTEQNQV